MAKKKAAQMNQKWIVAGLVVLVLGLWWMWKSAGQELKIAQVDAPSLVDTYQRVGGWAYGTAKTTTDISPALKAWVNTITGRETTDRYIVSVDKKKSFCSTAKLPTPVSYDAKKPYNFVVTGRITPKGMAKTDTDDFVEIGKRKITVSFLDSKLKVMGTGIVEMPVVSLVANSSTRNGSTNVLDEGEGGTGNGGGDTNNNTNTPKLVLGGAKSNATVVAAKEFLDKTALKVFQVKYCIDTSTTDAVDLEIQTIDWLLDTRYVGPADQVSSSVIVL